MRILAAIIIVAMGLGRSAAQSPGPITTNPIAAPIEKREANGGPTSRVDLNISRSRDGELIISSRQDGAIRMLVPDSSAR